MASGGSVEEERLKLQENLYKMFDMKVDKEIIALVLANCEYNENTAYEHILSMAGYLSEPDADSDGEAYHTGAADPDSDGEAYHTGAAAPDPDLDETLQAKPDCLVINDSSHVEDVNIPVVLSIQNDYVLERRLPPAPLANNSPTRPANLLEQLAHASVPPVDINVVMSSTSVYHQDPAIIQTGPSSPAVPSYSLFGNNPPMQRALQPSSPAKKADALFGRNPYITATCAFDVDKPAGSTRNLYGGRAFGTQGEFTSFFSHPTSRPTSKQATITGKDEDGNTNIQKLCDYVNHASRHIVILMRGLPGSGKSHKARELCGPSGVIFSTDDYFNKDGIYQFEPQSLSHAHYWNQERAWRAIESGNSPVFIDNTNMQCWEMKPYIEMAVKRSYEVKFIEPDTPWAWDAKELSRRNTHGVPKSKIQLMMERYERNDSIEDILRSFKGQQVKNTEKEVVQPADIAKLTIVNTTEEYRGNRKAIAIKTISPIACNPMQNTDDSTYPDETMDVEGNISKITSTPTSCANVNNDLANSQPRTLFNDGVAAQTHQGNLIERTEASKKETNVDFQMLQAERNVGNTARASVVRRKNTTVNTSEGENKISCSVSTATAFIPPPVSRCHNFDLKTPDANMASNVEDVAAGSSASIQTGIQTGRQGFRRGSRKKNHKHDAIDVDMEESMANIEENTSPGKISDLVKSFQSCAQACPSDVVKRNTLSNTANKPRDINLIDLTGEDHPDDLNQEVDTFRFNLAFIYECFPDLKHWYCEDWLKRYNGDLVRTCDYLSRLSQVEELPDHPNIPDIEELLPKEKSPAKSVSLQDIFENKEIEEQPGVAGAMRRPSTKMPGDILCNKDEEGDATLVLPFVEENQVNISQEPLVLEDNEPAENLTSPDRIVNTRNNNLTINFSNAVTQKVPSGELFYCDNDGEDSDGISIAIDTKLGKELIKMFGNGQQHDLDEFNSEDLILPLARGLGKQIFDSWMGSIKARKRKIKAMLEDDERFAQQLQNEENKQNEENNTNNANVEINSQVSPNRRKKPKKKGKKVDTPFANNQSSPVYDGSFKPNAWNEVDTGRLPIMSGSGKEVLTKKQMKLRQELHQKFPGAPEDALDNVLEVAGYNLLSAENIIRSSCGILKNQKVQNVYAPQDWTKISSPPRKKVNTSTSSPVAGPSQQARSPQQLQVSPYHMNVDNQMYQTMTEGNQSYQDFRAEAELHKNLRTGYFQKAAVAFQQKNGLVAQFYADKAREHTVHMNEAHARAAELTLERKNKQYMKEQQVIDFHGLHADEAIRATNNFLSNAKRLGHKSVFIITGRGNHSKNSYSTVRAAVMRALAANNFQSKMHSNGGMLEVLLR